MRASALFGKTVVAIAAGALHSLALCSDGTLAAWGRNDEGQLGDNTTTQRNAPVSVNTTNGTSALFGKNVVAVAAGEIHSLALCSDGTLAAWGWNGDGQLGDNTTTQRNAPVLVNTAIGISALFGKTVVALAAGGFHSLALCSDGTLADWGYNGEGQLGDNTTTNRPAPVLVNTTNGISALFGKNVVAVAAGEILSLALCSDGTLAAWGWNGYGQLGDNTTTNRFVPVSVNTTSGISALAGRKVSALAGSGLGSVHSLAIYGSNIGGSLAFAAPGVAVSEGNTATIAVSRTGDIFGTVTVKVSTSIVGSTATAGTDYDVVANQLITFDPGVTTKDVTFQTKTDTPIPLVEANESFNVILSAPTGGGVLGAQASAKVTIIDASALTFTGDNTAPTVTLASPANGSTQGVNTGAPLTITGSASDNKGVRKVQYSLNGAAFTDAILATPGATATAYSAAIFPLTGSNTLKVRSVDFATGGGNANVTSSSTGSKTVTVQSMPLGLVVNSDFMGRKVTAISGTTVTLSGNADATVGFVQVISSAINSQTVNVTAVSPGLAVGSTLLGRTVTGIAGTTITLNGNANAAIAAPTFVAFTPVVTVNTSSLASPAVTVASVPSILGVGSTLLGRSVTIIAGTTITLNGNANATIAAPTARAFTAAVPTPFTTTDRVSATITSTFKVLRPQLLGLNGSGTFAGASVGGNYREAGKLYTITAIPSAGQVFDRWIIGGGFTPGDIGVTDGALELPTLTFTFVEGLTLTAKFIVNPFVATVTGAFNGLIIPSDTLPALPAPGGSVRSNETVGKVTANVMTTGAFSGTFLIDGLSLGFAGVFDNTGTARFGTNRATTLYVTRITKPGYDLTLHLDLSPAGTNKITGMLTQKLRGAIKAVCTVDADRAYYNGTTVKVPANLAGTASKAYTIAFPAKGLFWQPAGFTLADYPQGDGYATASVNINGTVSFVGKLADGTVISASAPLSKANTWSLFQQLYGPIGATKGCIAGQVTLDDGPAQTESDMKQVAGTDVYWFRPLQLVQWYPYGWDEGILVDLLGAKYVVPPATPATSVFPGPGPSSPLKPVDAVNGNVGANFSEGLLSGGVITRNVNISPTNVVSKPTSNTDAGFTLVLTPSSGLLTGTFTHTDLSNLITKPAFQGVIIQKGTQRGAFGYFLTTQPTVIDYTGQSGLVRTAPRMVLIPAGTFTMGNSVVADTDITDAAPVSTTVSAFYMDANEVSLSQWQAVYTYATANGYTDLAAGSGKAANHPVQTVSWYDVVKWCNARSEQAGKTPVYYTDDAQTMVYRTGSVDVTNVQVNWSANGYRLPTEAEWEKAARGGVSGKRFPWGDTISQTQANYYGDTANYAYDLGPDGYNAIGSLGGTNPATSPVGSFAANGYGLCDMAGNVYEWCWDWYGTPYAGGTDPHGPPPGSYRVIRGGLWLNYAFNARCAYRFDIDPPDALDFIGFRAVLSPGQP